MKKVTVITPTYNRASYLDETIQSVLSQAYPDIEYIILDDGSTDNTKEVVSKYNVKYTRHENIGESRTVNKGFVMADSDIVVILNSDDLLLPGAISKGMAFIRDHPGIIVAYPDFNIIDQHSKITGHHRTKEYDYLYMLRNHICLPSVGTFIKRNPVLRNPQYTYVADYDYWLRLGLHGRFARIPETLACWRVHSEGASGNKGESLSDEHVYVIKKYYSSAGIHRNILKVKSEAFAWAHIVAATTSGKHRSLQHIAKAILYYPPVIFGVIRSLLSKFSVKRKIYNTIGWLFILLWLFVSLLIIMPCIIWYDIKDIKQKGKRIFF